MPARPSRKRKTEFEPFDGELIDRHTTQAGAEYLRFVFGAAAAAAAAPDAADYSRVYDAEFLFLKGEERIKKWCTLVVAPGGLVPLTHTPSSLPPPPSPNPPAPSSR